MDRRLISECIRRWQPTGSIIQTIDAHTCGEPLRIIYAGFPQLPGKNILAKRQYLIEHLDDLRTMLMWEPRGHADMYGCLIVPPDSEPASGQVADFGVLFLHNEGYSTMCGHGIIAVVTVAAETGWIDLASEDPVTVKIDSPAGRINAKVLAENGRVYKVSFENVASYAVAMDQMIATKRFGPIQFDVAFGGAFYAYIDVGQFDFGLSPSDSTVLTVAGRELKQAIQSEFQICHPIHPELSFLYGTIFTGPPKRSENHSRNVCVFADGEVDRSPTGTGVSGRAALAIAKNELEFGQTVTIESILGTTFDVCPSRPVQYAGQNAIIPTVTGCAHITGRHEFFADPEDPLGHGFLLR